MAWIAPVIAGAVSVIGGAMGDSGTRSQNVANAKEAQKNRDFQERMSNTAHQRQMADMRKAGLNPILSAKAGGASSPSGGQAVHQNEKANTAMAIQAAAQNAASIRLTSAQAKGQELENQKQSILKKPYEWIDKIFSGNSNILKGEKTNLQKSAKSGFDKAKSNLGISGQELIKMLQSKFKHLKGEAQEKAIAKFLAGYGKGNNKNINIRP